MKTEIVHSLTDTFEAQAKQTEGGTNIGLRAISSIFSATASGTIS